MRKRYYKSPYTKKRIADIQKALFFLTTTTVIALLLSTAPMTICLTNHTTNPAPTNVNNIDIDSIYHQLVIKKKNHATFECPKGIGINEILSYIVKIDKDDSLYDGSILRNRGCWTLSRQGTHCTLVAKNAYDIDKADEITSEIADIIKNLAGNNASERELFYEFTKYMADNFHYSKEISQNTQYMNKYHVVIPTDNFTDTYTKDRGVNCVGYATITYLVLQKLGIDCITVHTAEHVYNAVRFEDSDNYVTYDLTLQNKYAGLNILGNIESKVRYLRSKPSDRVLMDACNNGRVYKSFDLGEFVKEFRYYHGI